MNTKHLNSEKGQAIVYLAVGLVVFLGFVALAIDGGMVLADRRNSQNAADAAALAGAGKAASEIDRANKYYNANITDQTWDCTKLGFAINDAEFAAQSRAKENKFDIDYPRGTHDNNYVDATCNTAGKYIDVTVDILSETQSNFMQILFPHALQNHVVSVTRVFPSKPFGGGNAIVALNPDNKCNMVTGAGFNGNANVDVDGGGIFSNGCLNAKSGSVNVDVNDGDVEYFFNNFKPGIFTPEEPVLATAPILPTDYAVNLKPSDCNLPGAEKVASLPNMPTVMHAGLWCITGTLHITANPSIHGTGVTIYIPNGSLLIEGGDLELSAPDSVTPPTNHAIFGLLFYVPNGDVTLNGNNTAFYQGTILAPGPNTIMTVNGCGNSDAYHSQFIGWNVKIAGTALFKILYDAGGSPILPPTMELHK